MIGTVLWKSLRDMRRSVVWWSLGLVGLVAMMVAVYPTVRDNEELNELVESYPEALRAFIAFGGVVDYLSPAGYLGSELFSFMIPLLFLVAAIGNGAGTIAGEEERGTLELLLSAPVTRARIAVEKLAALVAELAVLGLVLWLALWVGARAADMEIAATNLGAATFAAALVALVYGTIAFLLGAATGRRALAIGVAAAAAVAAFLVNSLAALVDALEPLQRASPFYHYAASDPLREGVDVARMSLLAVIAVVAAGAGVVLLGRRDVR
jgi:ABC-2 type transport system permease protein